MMKEASLEIRMTSFEIYQRRYEYVYEPEQIPQDIQLARSRIVVVEKGISNDARGKADVVRTILSIKKWMVFGSIRPTDLSIDVFGDNR